MMKYYHSNLESRTREEARRGISGSSLRFHFTIPPRKSRYHCNVTARVLIINWKRSKPERSNIDNSWGFDFMRHFLKRERTNSKCFENIFKNLILKKLSLYFKFSHHFELIERILFILNLVCHYWSSFDWF